MWDITAMSAEEVLALVDRLRFDAAADADPPEEPEEPPPWEDPHEQMRSALAQMTELPPDDPSPKFLYVARPGEAELAKAAADAYTAARRVAERLAGAASRRLGGLVSVSTGVGLADHRTDRLMERQRCGALLATSSYALREGEVVSDDPRTTEITITVHATHHLE